MNEYLIENLIPHRDRMKLIDKIIDFNDNEVVISATIYENYPLVENKHANPIILIELIAQSAGVSEGLIRQKKGKPTVNGFLVGIRETNFYIDRVPINKELTISISKSFNMENYAIIKGKVELDGKKISDAVLQLVES